MGKKRLWLLTAPLLFCASAIWAQELTGPRPVGKPEQIRSGAVEQERVSVSRTTTPWRSMSESTNSTCVAHPQSNRHSTAPLDTCLLGMPAERRPELLEAVANPCLSYMRQCMSWCNAVGCFVDYISCDPDNCVCGCY